MCQKIIVFSRKTTAEELPSWVSIYYIKKTETEHCCNICELNLNVSEKSLDLLEHIKTNHKEVYDLHKENPEATVGFRIEFLHLNVLKDESDLKSHPVILGEMCEATTEEIVEPIPEKVDENATPSVVKKARRVRKKRSTDVDNRKRSWVWKYFLRMSNIIFRCNLCNVVLSIKGCNTNNMNRHIRSRHPMVYATETEKKTSKADGQNSSTEQLDLTEVETPFAIKTEEISASDREYDEIALASAGHRRSWIWLYFNRKSPTMAQCRLCNRNICHGGNATGNMNRHLKMIHNKTADDYTWIWKVFDNTEPDYYSCKICQYQCMKFDDADKSVSCILNHLKMEHGVISGDQIITGSEECEEVENN